MRHLFTVHEARTAGLTDSALAWGVATGRWRRVQRGVYADGGDDLEPLDVARARVLAADEVARGRLAGVLLGLDGVELAAAPRRHRGQARGGTTVAGGVPCVDALGALVDLAVELDDDRWEQALESALRRRLLHHREVLEAVAAASSSRAAGTVRMRRVLARRGDARPTESLLETLFVQLARTVPGLPDPVRQHEVVDPHGGPVARVDLCWPELGLFVELDGQHHLHQPEHDARRETAIVAATGWLVGRFTWREVTSVPRATARRLAALASQARARPPRVAS